MRVLKHITLFVILIFFHSGVFAIADSIVFKNNNHMVGEIKSLEKGVIIIETDYSDADFAIEWEGIHEVYSETFFLITLSSGERYNGTIQSLDPGVIRITTDDSILIDVPILELVFLESIDQGFSSRIYAAIDIGFELTKAQNLRSLYA